VSSSTAPSLSRRIWRLTLRLWVVQTIAIFLAAGTARYLGGWLYLGLQVLTMAPTNLWLLRHNPALLDRRMTQEETGEKEIVQRRVMALLRVLGLAMLITAGLDHRFGWSAVPLWLVVVACFVLYAGAALIVLVFRENTFGSSIIEVAEGQRVVTTGPYRHVRHPMYTGFLLMGIGAPLVLQSYVTAIAVLPTVTLLVIRILHEERFLEGRLEGYAAYLKSTRSRLVPGIW
jgi:protein-S-isoprenylcysteine O-methyltransferase Ste14